MVKSQEQELHIMVATTPNQYATTPEYANATNQSTAPRLNYKWWTRIAIYTFLLLSGQSVATLLLRLYYEKGGQSKWLTTIIQIAGFPFILCVRFATPKNPPTNDTQTNQRSVLVLATVYVVLGVVLAFIGISSSFGISYLPVSTYSLIYASQLLFNAFFSFFLNSQKFTPFIINSLVLLTVSSTLLVLQTDTSNPTATSKRKYLIGFLCTLFSAAGTGLFLSLLQLSFQKVLKRATLRAILDLLIYESLVATLITLVGLFASGEWKSLTREMNEFALGKLSYVMILIWTAIGWQLSSLGSIGLIFEVSAIFCNVISTLGLPIVPVLAVIFFHDKMNGLKVISLLLAVWGFVSYVYQNYLDDCESKIKSEDVDEVSEAPPTERG